MQIVQKQLFLKSKIGNKLEYRTFRRHEQLYALTPGGTCQLPAISKVTMTFPIKKNPKIQTVHTVHAPNKQMKLELQQIFQRNNIHLNGDKGKRIIFGGPIKTRLALNNTFRAGFSLDQGPNKTRYGSIPKKIPRKYNSHTLEQDLYDVEVNNSLNTLEELHSLTPTVGIKKTQDITAKSDVFNKTTVAPEKIRSPLRYSRKINKPEKGCSNLDRYSPWSPQNEEELLV